MRHISERLMKPFEKSPLFLEKSWMIKQTGLASFGAQNFACGKEIKSPTRRNSDGDTFSKRKINLFNKIDPRKSSPPPI